MQFVYDGQIRRYVTQIIRMVSGFRWEDGQGKQYSIPVIFGDMSRQVGSVINNNSENKLPSVPCISVYITGLDLDRDRLSDPTFVSKVHIRERRKLYDDQDNMVGYDEFQGDNYTVERLMPTPYKLEVKVDIWTSSTEQKLQILEQLLVFFNPSIEIQSNDNYIDWSSLTVVDLKGINYDSRTIPQGTESAISISTLTLETPIYINSPSKVKRMGIIHDIIMNIHDEKYTLNTDVRVNISGFNVFVQAIPNSNLYTVEFLEPDEIIQALPQDITSTAAFKKIGRDLDWRILTDMYPGKFKAGYSQLFLLQPNGNEIVGTTSIDQQDETKLVVHFDQDTYPTNTIIAGPAATKGTVDAIIDPDRYSTRPEVNGTRYLLLSPINDPDNDIPNSGRVWPHGFKANANDIIEWDATTSSWHIVLDSENVNEVVYATNIKSGVQYKFENNEWTRSFEGEYKSGRWRLML